MSARPVCTKKGGRGFGRLSMPSPAFTAGGACASNASNVQGLFSESREVRSYSYLLCDTRVFTLDMLDAAVPATVFAGLKRSISRTSVQGPLVHALDTLDTDSRRGGRDGR